MEGVIFDLVSLGADGLSPAGALRAVWPLDADADGDLDAIAIFTDGRTARLVFARRDGESFGSPTPLGGTLRVPDAPQKPADETQLPPAEPPEPTPCTLEGPEFVELGATRASVRYGLTCGAQAASTLTILDLGRTPRALLALTASGGLTLRA